MLTSAVTVGALCCRPGTLFDCHTSRAWSPLYQPIRNALTVNSRAVVDAYSVIGSPGSTLYWPVYPIISSGAPSELGYQFGSPGSSFSLTVLGRAAGRAAFARAAPCEASEPFDSVAFTAAMTAAGTAAAAAANPRNARRERRRRCHPTRLAQRAHSSTSNFGNKGGTWG